MSSTEPVASPAAIRGCDARSHPKLKSCSSLPGTALLRLPKPCPKGSDPQEGMSRARVRPEQAPAPTLAPPALCSPRRCRSLRDRREPPGRELQLGGAVGMRTARRRERAREREGPGTPGARTARRNERIGSRTLHTGRRAPRGVLYVESCMARCTERVGS